MSIQNKNNSNNKNTQVVGAKGAIFIKTPYELTDEQKRVLKDYAYKAFDVKEKIPVKFQVTDEFISGFKAYYLYNEVKEIDVSLDTVLRKSLLLKNEASIEKDLEKQLKTGPITVGFVTSLENVIAFASGLTNVAYGEIVEFTESGVTGMAFDLLDNGTGIIVLGDYLKIKPGEKVIATGKQLSIPVSSAILGRHVGTLGNPKDGMELKHTKDVKDMPLEKIAPGVMQRKSVDTPLQTGIKAVDTMIPIGRGQRELIIGDRKTGKTTLAIDTIINQKGQDVICVYVAIGQKASTVASILDTLASHGALEYTIVLSENASDPVSLQYLAPYAGTAIAEYFLEQGKDVLVVYDDLSKHAWAYREISLLLKRPPGREAYPGDVFYLHSRLLERACKLNEENGGGSITALPIIETQAGDVSAYIPTNVISITDGQIYLETDLFNAGVRPAINVGLSVSRVGSAAQVKAMKQVAGSLRLDLAQYRELAAFAQFGSELDSATQKTLDRGARLVELLKQLQHNTMPVELQVSIIYAGVNGYLDEIDVKLIKDWEKFFITRLNTEHKDLLASIKTEKVLTDEIKQKLDKAVKSSVEDFLKLHR